MSEISITHMDTLLIIAAFAPNYFDKQSIYSVNTINSSDNIIGVSLCNKQQSTVILYDLNKTQSGKYTVNIKDELLNVIMNLKPNKKYVINMCNEKYDKKSCIQYSDNHGIIAFKIKDPGTWEISLVY